jgi:hypothetical protein
MGDGEFAPAEPRPVTDAGSEHYLIGQRGPLDRIHRGFIRLTAGVRPLTAPESAQHAVYGGLEISADAFALAGGCLGERDAGSDMPWAPTSVPEVRRQWCNALDSALSTTSAMTSLPPASPGRRHRISLAKFHTPRCICYPLDRRPFAFEGTFQFAADLTLALVSCRSG